MFPLFKKYIYHILESVYKHNPELLATIKSENYSYFAKTESMFKTLKEIYNKMQRNGQNTQVIRQSMVDLVYNVGFSNKSTVDLLKSSNAMDKLNGLRQILNEANELSEILGYKNLLEHLKYDLKIESPTGSNKSENTPDQMMQFQKIILQQKYTIRSDDKVRVRSLSIQESPFRSCLGLDCSTRQYFETALDPNYIYFTMTDSNFHSEGHATVVLGSVTEPQSKKTIQVAFLDKLQNIQNQRIEIFLNAVNQSLKTEGYQLVIPTDLGMPTSKIFSNSESTVDFVQLNIMKRLKKIGDHFTPHPHNYSFNHGYSRAKDKMEVMLFEPKQLDLNTKITQGIHKKTYLARTDLNKNNFEQSILKLQRSDKQEDTSKFIAMTLGIIEFGLYSKEEMISILNSFAKNKNLSFAIRKQAAYEILLLENKIDTAFQWDFFDNYEKMQISSEIKQWSKTKNYRHKKFSQSLLSDWSFAITFSNNDKIKKLVESNLIDINYRDESGISMLLRAIYFEQKEIIDLLLDNPKLDINIKDELGFTDIERARLLGKNDLADYIELRRIESKSRKFKIKERSDEKTQLYPEGLPIVKFVEIRKGTFSKGIYTNLKLYKIENSFQIMSVTTTQRMWRNVLKLANSYFENKYSHLNLSPSYEKGETHPVETVLYADVIQWFEAVNELSNANNFEIQQSMKQIFPDHEKGDLYKLPSEAEMEYVARIGGLANGLYLHSLTENNLTDYMWNYVNSDNKTHPVGLKKPIFYFGEPIYDIIGNVAQYVENPNPNNTRRNIVFGGGFESFRRSNFLGYTYSKNSDFLERITSFRISRVRNAKQ